jgi:hypothetical protein
MPRETRRGGRYTTGIKRAPGGGYGGQTTGRRGCMILLLPLLAIVGALAAVLS